MSATHCPGFESNKSLTEVKLKCPECGHKWDVFSDELKETVVCPGCGKGKKRVSAVLIDRST